MAFGIDDAIAAGLRIIDKFIPDPAAKERAISELRAQETQLKLAENELAKGQQSINLEEAKSTSLFVSGWRPFVGWVGGAGFAYAAIVEPLMRFVSSVFFSYTGSFPAIDTWLTLQVLSGLLGLAALRTREKEKGVAAT